MPRSKSGENFPSGIVEGFYGPPWSHLDRLYMIRFLSEAGFNTYMYAPKDDEYHRAEWRKDYPESAARNLRELINACALFSVNFVFTVSPGLTMVYSDSAEVDLLLKKLRASIDMGCTWVGVLLDDIGTELTREQDKKTFSSLAKAHASLLNGVKDELQQNGKIKLCFCPTYYANDYLGKKIETSNDYLFEIGADLDQSVDILWTGKFVASPTITVEDAQSFSRVVKRKPLLWDNYPVNDYFHSERGSGLRLNVGPFSGRSPELPNHLAGYLSNPMNEIEASRVPLLTLSHYLSHPRLYSPWESYKKALEHVTQSEDGARKELQDLMNCSKASALDPSPEAEDLRSSVNSLKVMLSRSKKPSATTVAGFVRSMREKLDYYEALGRVLEAEARNRKLLLEFGPALIKLRKLSLLGIKCLEYVEVIAKDAALLNNPPPALEAELKQAAKIAREDRTQILGQVDFGWRPAEGKTMEYMDDMGLPQFYSESPIFELYEYITSKWPGS